MLKKVIRFDKCRYKGKKYNHALEINKALALAEGICCFECIPKRRAYRKYIMSLCNRNSSLQYPVSHKDIKRLECAGKCELPINAVDILEVLIAEIAKMKNNFNYKAQDTYIISRHILNYTVESLEDFRLWLRGHKVGEMPECDKFRDEVAYIKKRLDEFDEKHPGIFNSLLN